MAYNPITPITGDGEDSVYADDAMNGVFIHDDTHPHAEIVHVFGEAIFADRAALEAIIAGAIRIGRLLVIEMRECTYMDCAVAGVLVRAAKNLGDRLRLVIPRSSQRYRMLDLTGLTRVLHIYETVDEAVAPLEDAPPRVRLRSV